MDEIILSVSMPNYNHASYLRKRIPSLLEALPPNGELIIFDDGSTDESVSIIEQFASTDSRLVFIKSAQNVGVMSALGQILEKARGKYISFQSADDYILPDFFTKLLQVAKDFPNFGIYCSNFGCSHGSIPTHPDQICTQLLLEGAKEVKAFYPEDLPPLFFKSDFWVPGHASILRRDWVMKMGGFNPILQQHADWFMIHSIALLAGVVYLPETLSVWRIDTESFTSREIAKRKALYKIQMSFFEILQSKENQALRKKFRNGVVLRGAIRKRLFSLCIRPKYWDYLFFFTLGYLRRKCLKYLKI